jgi:hypothetical protein
MGKRTTTVLTLQLLSSQRTALTSVAMAMIDKARRREPAASFIWSF